jgi:hypothetical protein
VANVSRARASFRIGADLFTNPPGALPNAKAVTARLGLEPSHVHEAGEHRSDRAAPYKHGHWSLRSPLAQSEVLETHLRWLLERLLPVREQVLEIISTDERLRADFFCVLFMKEVNEGFILSPITLEGIAALNAEIGFDIYWEGDESIEPLEGGATV